MRPEMKNIYEDWILKENHPCVMAQTVFSQNNLIIKDYGTLGKKDHSKKIYHDLTRYVESYDETTNQFQTFLAIFPESKINSEDDFEALLWKELNNINGIDTVDWDPEVSSDPASKDFSFSIAGKAFYIVGMHPKSSRFARRSPYPTIAFNLHSQFEKLRHMGAFQKVKNKIRARDKELQGNINPELEDFGDNSEARQYSGKSHGASWKCPFKNLNK